MKKKTTSNETIKFNKQLDIAEKELAKLLPMISPKIFGSGVEIHESITGRIIKLKTLLELIQQTAAQSHTAASIHNAVDFLLNEYDDEDESEKK